jgi:hypothetical protein
MYSYIYAQLYKRNIIIAYLFKSLSSLKEDFGQSTRDYQHKLWSITIDLPSKDLLLFHPGAGFSPIHKLSPPEPTCHPEPIAWFLSYWLQRLFITAPRTQVTRFSASQKEPLIKLPFIVHLRKKRQ